MSYDAAAVFQTTISIAVVNMLQKEAIGLLLCVHGYRVAAGENNCCFAGSSFGPKTIMFLKERAE